MAEFVIIPKVLPARHSMEYVQKIPKIIWQTMKTNRVPVFMKNYADTWIDLNPEYEYRFCDDNDIIDFIKTDFPAYLDAYKKMKYGASRADLWRYLVIYKYGGVYADMDCRCINPLRQWIDPEAAFVTQLGSNKDLCQWLIISVAQNPIFLKAAQKTLYNTENNKNNAEYYGFELIDNNLVIRESVPLLKFNHEVLGMSGPPVLQESAEICFNDSSVSDFWQYTQVVCISGSLSCQMNGNVKHSRPNEYIKALKKLKLKHYDSRIARIKARIKRKIIIFLQGKKNFSTFF